MSDDDATLRAQEARATHGPRTPVGDKVRATAADAQLPDTIVVACYTGHDHRLGLTTTGHAADVEFISAARTALPDRLDRLDPVGDARSAPRRGARMSATVAREAG